MFHKTNQDLIIPSGTEVPISVIGNMPVLTGDGRKSILRDHVVDPLPTEKLLPASLMRSPEKSGGCNVPAMGLLGPTPPVSAGANDAQKYPVLDKDHGAFDKLPENLTKALQKSVDAAKQETQYYRQRSPGKWNGLLGVLSQLTKGPCPDGGIISKHDRDVLVKAGLVLRIEGWNQLSTTGTTISLALGLLRE